jgi:hypothetical protein
VRSARWGCDERAPWSWKAREREVEMKLVIRTFSALAVLGLASPALPCPSQKQTTADAKPAQPAAGAKQEKQDKEKVSKSEKAKKQQQKSAQDQKNASAVN